MKFPAPQPNGLEASSVVSRPGAAPVHRPDQAGRAAAGPASCAYAWRNTLVNVAIHGKGIDTRTVTTFKLRPRRPWSSSH